MSFWNKKKVTVIGAGGFVGSHITELLVKNGANVKAVIRNPNSNKIFDSIKGKFDIITKNLTTVKDCSDVIKNSDIVINSAAKVGGIGFNSKHSGQMFFENSYLALIVLEATRLENVERFSLVSSVDVYSDSCKIPIKEDDGFKDEPEGTTASYGWAKRVAELQAKFYENEYNMKIAIVRPSGIYGPRDYFDKERTHVIPSLITKVFDAKESIMVWGSGKQKRTFTYIKDVVQGILDATEKYAKAHPLNLSSDDEISIKDLAELIIKKSGRKLDIEFDLSKPEGYRRTKQDISLAKSKINWVPKYSLDEGLSETIKWYKNTILTNS